MGPKAQKVICVRIVDLPIEKNQSLIFKSGKQLKCYVSTGDFHYHCLATLSESESIGEAKLGLTSTGFVKALQC